MKRIVIELDDNLHQDFKVQCASDRSSIKDMVTDLIKQYLELITIKKDGSKEK